MFSDSSAALFISLFLFTLSGCVCWLPIGQFNYFAFFYADASKIHFCQQRFFFLSLLLFLSSPFPNFAFSEGKQFALMLTLGFSQADQNNWQVIYNKNALHTRMRDSERQNSNWTDLTDCNFDEFMIDSSEASELFINHTVIQATKCLNRTFIHMIHI